jgi:S-adenosylmethionine decarboxylase
MEYQTFGRHVMLDVWGVDFNKLNDLEGLRDWMCEAAKKCGATVLEVSCKKFYPHGVTVLVLLSESHLSIHTYPEKGFAGIDGYTCGDTVDPEIAINYLIEQLQPKESYCTRTIRGTGEFTTTKLLLDPVKGKKP